MRTTLDIDDDVLQAAKELAAKEKSTTGRMLSSLARRGLLGAMPESGKTRNKVPVIPSRGEIVTTEKVNELSDHEGI
jgi:hypothetical protein